MKCPHCGSNKLTKHSKGIVAGFKLATRYHCKSCGKHTTKPIVE